MRQTAKPAVVPGQVTRAPREERCRLCSGEVVPVFSKIFLRCFPVSYFRCALCESLQTERPYWLEEAYSPAAPPLDIPAITRALAIRSFTCRVLELLATPRQATLLDWGAGNGILVRLLRDVGIRAYGYDKYVRPLYTEVCEPPLKCDVVTAFEVWEHFAEPLRETDRIFGYRPSVHIISTEFHRGQPEDWSYLHPEIGRHVFFYSERALRFVAQRHGYEVIHASRFAVFANQASFAGTRTALMELLENPAGQLG